MPLLALGPHQFEIMPLNFQQIERTTVAKWPALARFGSDPGRQFTGYGEDTITITGLLYPDEMGGREEFEAIRTTQRGRAPVTMIGWADTEGMQAKIYGQVLILQVHDAQNAINLAGLGRRIQFDISLTPYRGGGKPIGLF